MRSIKSLLTLAIAGVLSTNTYANVLEEVVVTAQKREQNVQDVGIAVTAMTGEQLEALGYDNAQDVTAMAAGVSTVQPNGEANYAIAMRGVAANDFTTNVESPVAVYLDEVYISQMSGTGFALFDMERVELLKGPQGTLYGRNATGGLAHFVSVKPSQELEGYAKVTYGDYDQIKFEGAVGGGLTENLSARLSVSTHDNDGYIENRLGGDLNNAEDRSYRLQFLWENEATEVLLSLRASDQDIDTGFFEHVTSLGAPGELTPELFNSVLGYQDTDGDVFAGDYDDPGYNDLETRGYSLTVKHDFENFRFTSITDLSTVERKYIEDSDASPAPVFQFFLNTDAEQFSQELRLDGENETIKWVAGVYYMDLDIDDSNGAITDPFVGPAPTAGAEAGLINPYTSDLQSMSAFGQVEYALSDNMNLVFGARVINDEKDFDYSINIVEFLDPEARNFDADGNVNQLLQLAAYSGSQDDTEWSTRLSLDWFPNEDTLYYVSWNRGVKGGGFNAPIFPLNPPATDYNDATMAYGPEQLDAFEIGAKWTFMGGLTRVNAAAYYYDYEDYQAFNIIGIDTLTVNAEAESRGFEVEVQSSPGEGWDIILGIAYNDIDIELPDGVDTTSVQSPEWATNIMVRKAWNVGSGYLAIQADSIYRSEHFFSLTGLDAVTENGYTLSNVALTYRPENDKWEASAFINNVTDEEYLVQTFDLSTEAAFGMTEQYYGKPKWWGLSFRYNF